MPFRLLRKEGGGRCRDRRRRQVANDASSRNGPGSIPWCTTTYDPLSESTVTEIAQLTRIVSGLRSAETLIALTSLFIGGYPHQVVRQGGTRTVSRSMTQPSRPLSVAVERRGVSFGSPFLRGQLGGIRLIRCHSAGCPVRIPRPRPVSRLRLAHPVAAVRRARRSGAYGS